jgi:hypothetical protein
MYQEYQKAFSCVKYIPIYENIVAYRWRLTNERLDYHCRSPLAADK